MSPPIRRRATRLLWLMLALLPLRGLAASVMIAASVPLPALAAVDGAIPAAAAAPADAPACHVEGIGSDAPHAHALCDLCHAVVAPAPAGVIALAPANAAALAGWIPRGFDGPRPATPYKPPRR